MHAYSVKVLRTLRLKNRITVNVLVRCELYAYMCTFHSCTEQAKGEARERNQLHTKALTRHLCSIMEFLPLSH